MMSIKVEKGTGTAELLVTVGARLRGWITRDEAYLLHAELTRVLDIQEVKVGMQWTTGPGNYEDARPMTYRVLRLVWPDWWELGMYIDGQQVGFTGDTTENILKQWSKP